MAGYNGYSMSNNAVYAYLDGEKPYSKWNKEELIESIKYLNPSVGEKIEELKCTVEFLKEKFLIYTSYHHTSKFYNKTDFYKIDDDLLEDYSVADLEKDYNHFQFYKKQEREIKKIKKWLDTIIDRGENKIKGITFKIVSIDNFKMIVENEKTKEQIEIGKGCIFYHNYENPYNQFLIDLKMKEVK